MQGIKVPKDIKQLKSQPITLWNQEYCLFGKKSGKDLVELEPILREICAS